jgi:3-methyladenine DNA glycosylase AlkD
MKSRCREILRRLEELGDPKNVEGMKRYGINVENAYGVSVWTLRKMGKELGTDHELALELWDTGVHEARLLAAFVADAKELTEQEMELWVSEFDSWDVCDQVCSNLFDETAFAYQKAVEWSARNEEFVKRAGFVLMAALSVHDKKAKDSVFVEFLPIIKESSTDERNFVRKAINWALRQIGKRNMNLNREAICAGEEILKIDSKSARWIARDALRELRSDKVRKRLQKRARS